MTVLEAIASEWEDWILLKLNKKRKSEWKDCSTKLNNNSCPMVYWQCNIKLLCLAQHCTSKVNYLLPYLMFMFVDEMK